MQIKKRLSRGHAVFAGAYAGDRQKYGAEHGRTRTSDRRFRGTCGNRKGSDSERLSAAFGGGTLERTTIEPQKLAMTGFEKLDVWKSGCRLAVEVYSELQNSRDYGLRDQMQRAAVSIPSNIAEGSERKGTKEFIQFLYIAKGSCAELRTQLYIASCIGAISASSVSKLTGETKRIAAMLSSLINTLEQKHRIKS